MPVLSTILAYFLGTDPAPEITTYIGGCIMLGGVAVIIKYG